MSARRQSLRWLVFRFQSVGCGAGPVLDAGGGVGAGRWCPRFIGVLVSAAIVVYHLPRSG